MGGLSNQYNSFPRGNYCSNIYYDRFILFVLDLLSVTD